MSDQASASALLRVHDEVDELFLVHQELLLVESFALSLQLLEGFGSLLRLHMKHEEESMLPVLDLEPSPRYPARVYRGQHEKMLALLSAAGQLTAALADNPAEPRRRIITLLDRERTFKDLSEHHDATERAALYPIFDAHCPPSRLKVFVEESLLEYEEERARIAPIVEAAARALKSV